MKGVPFWLLDSPWLRGSVIAGEVNDPRSIPCQGGKTFFVTYVFHDQDEKSCFRLAKQILVASFASQVGALTLNE